MSLASLLGKIGNGGGELPTIDHAAFTRVVAEKSRVIVDVREGKEFATGHIPGAINIPLSCFTPEDLPAGKPVVLVCLAGGRSAKALQQALSAGYNDVCHYAPGTGGWRNLGGAIVA